MRFIWYKFCDTAKTVVINILDGADKTMKNRGAEIFEYGFFLYRLVVESFYKQLSGKGFSCQLGCWKI